MQEEQPDRFKFVPPAPPFGFMDRPRLFEPLGRGLSGRLVLIQAPAGYGKTSLLASLAAAVSAKLAWYQLDPSDDDPAVFLEGLVESLQGVMPFFGKTTRAALSGTSDASGDFPRLMDVLQGELRTMRQQAVFVVLDDFHLIADKVVMEVLERTIRDPSSPLGLVISTEVEPHFYLSNLRSQGALVELGEDDLRFTPEEVQRLLLQRAGSALDRVAVDNVTRETGGWPSATALAAVIVARSGRPLPFNRLAPTEHGYTQLVKEVLAPLPKGIRESLVRTSLLPYVEPATAQTLAGVADALAIFHLVEDAKLPAMMLGGSGKALRYDPLFGAALRRELSAAVYPQEMMSLQKGISSYMASRGRCDEAVRGYLQAGAYEEAAALAEEAAGEELARGHLDTVLRWVRTIPSLTRRGHPRLMVLEARALLAKGKVDEARALLVTVQPDLQSAGDLRGLVQRTSSWSRVHLMDRRYRDSKKIAEEAARQLPEDDEAERAELFWLLASSHEMMGELPAAFAAASEGLLVAEQSGQQPMAVRALSQLGKLAELRGDYTEALALTGRAVERSTLLGTEELAVALTGGLVASVYLERDQPEEAVAAAERAWDASDRLRETAGSLRARLALLRAGKTANPRSGWDVEADELLDLANKMPARHPERALVLQVMAAELLRQGKRKDGARTARMALDAAVATTHQPLIEQCQLLVAASEAMGPGVLGLLMRTRRVRDALTESDSRRWLSASQRLLAQWYALLGLGWRARANLEKSLVVAAAGGHIGMPLGLPSRSETLLSLAVRHDVVPELAGTLLGADPTRGGRLLASSFSQKNPELRARAEKAAKGLEAGFGKAPRPRLPWPGLADRGDNVEQVALQALGGINPFVDLKRVEWPSSDARNLAAYFVVNRDTALPRETLLHDVWPDTAAAEAHVRLQVALYKIRETLGAGYPQVDLRLESRGSYRWSGEGCLIDVEHFRELFRESEQLLVGEEPPVLTERTAGVLEEAVSIYQGEFLPDLDFGWCVGQREELRSQLLRTTRLLMDHYMALQRWRDAIRYGMKSLKSDPLQEEVVRDLMVCYFRIGDRGSVMQQYREVKRLLAKERGEWPSEETRKVRVRLLGR